MLSPKPLGFLRQVASIASNHRLLLGSGELNCGAVGDYTVAIWATVGLVVAFTVPVVWQFLQPNDDDFGDLTKRPK